MIELVIDGKKVNVKKGSTILQACSTIGIEIPRFCYHEKLSIAGNCRMCLVEVENSPKPVASCAMPAMDKMVVKTKSMMVKKAREGVLELLLVNHPLDCPICDQGGECDLQDQAMVFGNDRGRYFEYKRAVQDKNVGPLIKTVMTRCIHCTRCVRFATEIAGVETLGTTGRGSHTEIGTYIEKTIDSELSGNLIDLCPVGALTSKPYAFTARPWELKGIDSIDIFDGVGSNIRVDVRGSEIMRILPRVNEEINEEWISDKARFAYDGLKRQRLVTPMVRSEEGVLVPCDWEDAFIKIKEQLSITPYFRGVCGSAVDSETMLAFRKFLTNFASANWLRRDSQRPNIDLPWNYLLNKKIQDFSKSDFCLLVGSNPRWEAPTFNSRIRQLVMKGEMTVASIGPELSLTYPVTQISKNLGALVEISEGRHPICQNIAKSKNAVIVVGSDLFTEHNAFLSKILPKICRMALLSRDSINILHKESNAAGMFDLGLPSILTKDSKNVSTGKNKLGGILYLLSADECEVDEESFIIYQGHHGDRNAAYADVILPGLAFTEKNGHYVNTEGRAQEGKKATSAPGKAQPDWEIFSALCHYIGGSNLPITFNRLRQELIDISPIHGSVGTIDKQFFSFEWRQIGATEGGYVKSPKDPYSPSEILVIPSISDYYLTHPITRASKTMLQCSEQKLASRKS